MIDYGLVLLFFSYWRSKTPDGRRQRGTMSWWRFAERRRSREATWDGMPHQMTVLWLLK